MLPESYKQTNTYRQIFAVLELIERYEQYEQIDNNSLIQLQVIKKMIKYVERKVLAALVVLETEIYLRYYDNDVSNRLISLSNTLIFSTDPNIYIPNITKGFRQMKDIVAWVNQYLPYEIPSEETIENLLNSFYSALDNFKNKIQETSSDLENKLSELTQKLEASNKELKEQEDRINKLYQDFVDNFENFKDTIRNEWNDERENYKTEAQKMLGEILSKYEEAKKIVHIISNSSIAGAYQKNAEYHRRQGYIWMTILISFVVIVIGTLFYMSLKVDNLDLKVLLVRISIVFPLLIIIYFAISQINKHREQEIYNKKMELDLSAIDPFISVFEKQKQHEIKKKLAYKYFNPIPVNKYNNNNDVLKTLTKISELLKNVIQQTPPNK